MKKHTSFISFPVQTDCRLQTPPNCLLPVQVYKGLKNDVQQVAIKVIDHTDAQQLAEFAKVSPVPIR